MSCSGLLGSRGLLPDFALDESIFRNLTPLNLNFFLYFWNFFGFSCAIYLNADSASVFMQEKSIVLIDGENVLNGWRRYCYERGLDDRLDYQKLVTKLSEGTNLLRAYFYDGVQEELPLRKKKFLTALQRNGIQLRIKVLKSRSYKCAHCGNRNDKQVQKGVDVSLATDILRHAWQKTSDVCIIVSGDEDYKDAIEVAKDKGVKIWVASFSKSLSVEIRNNADRVILLENIFEDVKLNLPKSLNT